MMRLTTSRNTPVTATATTPTRRRTRSISRSNNGGKTRFEPGGLYQCLRNVYIGTSTIVPQKRLITRHTVRHRNGTAHLKTCERDIGTNDSDQRASMTATRRTTSSAASDVGMSAPVSTAVAAARCADVPGKRTVAVTIGKSPASVDSWTRTPCRSSPPISRSRVSQSMRSKMGSAHSSSIWLVYALPMP